MTNNQSSKRDGSNARQEVFSQLIALLDSQHEEWFFEGNRIENSQVTLEFHSFLPLVEIYPMPLGFSLVQRCRLWNATRGVVARQVLRQMQTSVAS